MYNSRKKSVIMTMFWYWIIIIVWQYIRPVANRSLLDTLVKIGMFGLVILYAMRNGHGLATNKNMGTGIILFFLTQAITVFGDSGTLSTGNMITIVFMFLQIIIFLVMLDSDTITKEDLFSFCKFMLIVALIMCVYNVMFHTNRFLATFSSSGSAYGRECKSFLYSNHEFGIYLSTAIISSCWLTIKGKLNKILFVLCGVFMAVNLLSTYSRTAILGCVAALFILVFFYRKKLFAGVSILFGGLMAYIISNPTLNNIVFNKIMKGSFDDGQVFDESRSSMYAEEVQNFLNGTFFQKLFGYGYAGFSKFPGHDAYIDILLTGGIIMFFFFIAVILLGFNYSFKIMRVDKSVGSLMIGYQVFCVLYMVAQTPILFYSTMDSFFITILSILIPKYVYNHFHRLYDEHGAKKQCG